MVILNLTVDGVESEQIMIADAYIEDGLSK